MQNEPIKPKEIDFSKIDINNRTVEGHEKEIITDLDQLAIPCQPCGFSDEEILQNQQIAADLITTIQAHKPKCIGLAANQIGYDKAIFVYHYGINPALNHANAIVVVNPKLIPLKSFGMRKYGEACMSYPETMQGPEFQHVIRRFKKVKLFFKDVFGNPETMLFANSPGVIIQHEMDHLNGVIR